MQSVLCAMQITDVDLMELIRKNIKLTIPYAGAFLKRDDTYNVYIARALMLEGLKCFKKNGNTQQSARFVQQY